MADILILSLVFPPDGVSTATLYGKLAEELQKLGHRITVLTATPHYNMDAEARRMQPLNRQLGGFIYRSNYKGITVYHAPVSAKGERVGKRLIDYTRFHVVTTLLGIFNFHKFDIILTPSPPLTIGLSAWLISKWHRIPYIYNVQEIFPDIAVKLGVLKNTTVIRLLNIMERFIYEHSRNVVVISDWFRKRLLRKGLTDRKIKVIPNFTDTDFMLPGERHNTFSKQNGLDDKFVILYAGNIGLTQNFSSLLGASKKLKHIDKLCFLIVGDGARSDWLRREVENGNYPNIKILPYQFRSRVPEMYAASDVCIVPLRGGTAQETFPSKIYTIMAAGRAAVVAADSNTELEWLVGAANCGWSVPPDDENALADCIERIYRHPESLIEKGLAGRRYVEQYHSRQAVAVQYDTLIREISSACDRP